MSRDASFFKGFITGAVVTLAAFLILKALYPPIVSPPISAPEVKVEVPAAKEEIGLEAYASKGPAEAPIKLIEYSDFYCHFCKKTFPALKKLYHDYAGKIYWEFHPFVLSSDPAKGSFPTHKAAECAKQQGKFWEFHDWVYSFPGTPTSQDLDSFVTQLGLDRKLYDACMQEGTVEAYLLAERQKAMDEAGVRGTPHFVINGRTLSGAKSYEEFSALIEGILDPSKAVVEKKPAAAAPKKEGLVVFDDLDGRPSAGDPNAPVTLVEFSDFHCPFCSRLTPTIKKLMENYPGKIRRVWRHYPLPMHKGSERTHAASECAFEQGGFWEYHDKLFDKTGNYRTDEALIGLAEETGLDVPQFRECLESDKYLETVRKDIAKGAVAGVRGTPATFINGKLVSGARPYAVFEYEVETILNPGKVIPSPEPAKPAVPKVPEVVQFDDLKDLPSQGPKKAPVTIVEFSDFHCPFCKRGAETIKKVMEAYKGKVRLVWRHFPLPMHKGAKQTHAASECAHEQGKFWKFHDVVFAASPKPANNEDLIRLAKDAGLKMRKFKKCLKQGKYLDLVGQEVKKGQQYGVRGTPAFFVNGRLISGAQPFARFKSVIDRELETS
ncbi:DsbA family protein [Omnitrophica bacterium]|nr:DsbA family protein [Candidatus Omnitrophota bacterium]